MICAILGYGARPLPILERIMREEGIEGLAISEERCEEELERIRKAKAIFIYASRIPEAVAQAIRSSKAKVVEFLLGLGNVPPEIAARAKSYYILGGEGNLRNLLRLLLLLEGREVELEEPREEAPLSAVWHPKLGVYRTAEDYLSAYHRRPLVGILFWRSSWLYGETGLVESLVEELEGEGLGVLPVFYHPKDELTGIGIDGREVLRKFFREDGRTRIKALVSFLSFGIAHHFGDLAELGVPVFSPIRSYHQSLEEWRGSEQGVDYMTQVYGVIVPEVPGAIEPLFICGTRNREGRREEEPFGEHVSFLARRVRKWIELSEKPKDKIKIGIILINPPCKGLEANVAVGMGLDVPESIAKLLLKLREEGYDVGGEIPRSGEELVKLIMERKAISEFRWTSVEEIVRRGGAADFVGLEEYLSWLSELPEDLREKIVRDWGRPEDVLSGKAPKTLVGMVYDGKFVVPGIKFGNVFITPQPKFGCAGARCDGKVCRILHDPTITPPHQWWAVYRWITRKFGADILVHFGTHGYLEFRPGKGVGLSPSCVPEASLDDVPHLYVYNVSNPMEGVIAKRRSYAEIVDHIYPPLALADVLEELAELLNQYAKAKSLGEEGRRRKLYEEILKRAREHNIRLEDPEDEERTSEELHRFLDLMRGSQVNLGLHVFGNPPRDPKRLSSYVASAMAYDSHASPSIRRALAEALGFDYEKLRSDPLGMTAGRANREILEALSKIAEGVLERLLREGSDVEGRSEGA